MAVGDEWAHLRNGAFVVKTTPTQVHPVAHDRDRERCLWDATTELLERAWAAHRPGTAPGLVIHGSRFSIAVSGVVGG